MKRTRVGLVAVAGSLVLHLLLLVNLQTVVKWGAPPPQTRPAHTGAGAGVVQVVPAPVPVAVPAPEPAAVPAPLPALPPVRVSASAADPVTLVSGNPAAAVRSGAAVEAPAPTARPPSPPDVAPAHHRPVLPTAVPASFEQALRARRGHEQGSAHWSWALVEGRFHTRLQARLGSGAAVDWASQGGVDDRGVAPERFLSRPLRGGARAVNFEREHQRVSFSGPAGHAPLVQGAQDRLSWLAQILALLSAHPTERALPQPLVVWVAGPQGDAQDWGFEGQWQPQRGLWHLRRPAFRRYDLDIEVWVTGGPNARLARLRWSHEGSSRPPWELWDPEIWPQPTE